MFDPKHGNLGLPEEFAREHATVPGHDNVLLVYNDRIYPSKYLDAARDLPNLLLRVHAGVVRISSK